MVGQKMPVATFRAGPVSSAIWRDQIQVKGKTIEIFKVTIQRRYKDRDGNWQSSYSFSRNEIPLGMLCFQQAFEKIIEMQNEERSNSKNNNIEEVVK